MALSMTEKQRQAMAKKAVAARQTRQFSKQARDQRAAMRSSSRSPSRSSTRSYASNTRLARDGDMYSAAVRRLNKPKQMRDPVPRMEDSVGLLNFGGGSISTFGGNSSDEEMSVTSLSSTSTMQPPRNHRVMLLKKKMANDPWHKISVKQTEYAEQRQQRKREDLHRRQKQLGVELQQQIMAKRATELKEAQLAAHERQALQSEVCRNRADEARKERELYRKKLSEQAQMRDALKAAVDDENAHRREIREHELKLDRAVLAKEQRDLAQDRVNDKRKRDKLIEYQALIVKDRRELWDRRRAQFEQDQQADRARLQRAITAPSRPRRTVLEPPPGRERFLQSMQALMSKDAQNLEQEEQRAAMVNKHRNDEYYAGVEAKDRQRKMRMREHLAGLYEQAKRKQDERAVLFREKESFEATIVAKDRQHVVEAEEKARAVRRKNLEHRRLLEEQRDKDRLRREAGVVGPMSPVEFKLNKAVLSGLAEPPDRVF